MPDILYKDKGAVLSSDGMYRYLLWREWYNLLLDRTKTCLFIMLNPSTADAEVNDPTIVKDINFTIRFECNRLEVVNFFAFRSSKPSDLKTVADPVGPENDRYIAEAIARADLIICAWGTQGHLSPRVLVVREMLRGREYWALRLTPVSSAPEHPLYVPYNIKLVPLHL